jgi:hypothetical protein
MDILLRLTVVPKTAGEPVSAADILDLAQFILPALSERDPGALSTVTSVALVEVTEMDHQAVARVRAYLGHIQDMPADEYLFLLGYLSSAVERLAGKG